jgi:hypothetical protein
METERSRYGSDEPDAHTLADAEDALELTGAELVAEHTGRLTEEVRALYREEMSAVGINSERIDEVQDAVRDRVLSRPITVDGFPYTTTAPAREA